MSSPRKRKSAVVASGMAGLAIAAGLVLTPHAATPSHALDVPGAGDVIGMIEKVHTAYERCKVNEAAGLDCYATDQQTLTQVHKMLSEFVAQYNKDQQRNSAALQAIIDNQKDAQMQASLESVKADIATTHVGLNMYDSLVDCMTVAAGGPGGTCTTTDQFGGEHHGQPATQATLDQQVKLLIANSKSEVTGGTRGYRLSADDFVQRMSGDSINPYKGRGVLHSAMEVMENTEVKRQGLLPGSHLTLFPASYVNALGNQMYSLIDLEEGYFTARIAAAQLDHDTTLSNDLDYLAKNGRTKGSTVLSLDQQRFVYGFPVARDPQHPDWSPENPLPANVAFYKGPNSGAVELINHGSMGWQAARGQQLPTTKQVENLAKDMANDPGAGRWSLLAKSDPQVLAAPTRSHPSWEPARGDVWTSNRPVWVGEGHAPQVGRFDKHITFWKDTRTGEDRRNDGPMQAKFPVVALNAPDSNGFSGSMTERPVPVNVYDDAGFVDRNNAKMAHEVKEEAYWKINNWDICVKFDTVKTQYSAPAFEHYTYNMGPENIGFGNWVDHQAYDAGAQSQVLEITSVSSDGLLSAY